MRYDGLATEAEYESMNIQLYFFPGTCSRVSMIALEQCDLSYETIVVHNRKGEPGDNQLA